MRSDQTWLRRVIPASLLPRRGSVLDARPCPPSCEGCRQLRVALLTLLSDRGTAALEPGILAQKAGLGRRGLAEHYGSLVRCCDAAYAERIEHFAAFVVCSYRSPRARWEDRAEEAVVTAVKRLARDGGVCSLLLELDPALRGRRPRGPAARGLARDLAERCLRAGPDDPNAERLELLLDGVVAEARERVRRAGRHALSEDWARHAARARLRPSAL